MLTAATWKEYSQPQSIPPEEIANLGIDLYEGGKQD